MDVDSDIVFCRGNPVFHSEQYLCGHVQEYGHAQRYAGSLYKPALSAMGDKASLEPVCRYNQKQEMVDTVHADPDVGCHASDAILAASYLGRRACGFSDVLYHPVAFLGNGICFRYA